MRRPTWLDRLADLRQLFRPWRSWLNDARRGLWRVAQRADGPRRALPGLEQLEVRWVPTISVGGNTYTTLQDAVNAASSGATISVTGSNSGSGAATINKSLTISGSSGASLDGGLTVASGNTVSISNVALSGGYSGVEVYGAATISNVSISGYTRWGILVDGSSASATISGCTITGLGGSASSGQDGVQVSTGALASVSGCTVTANTYFGSVISTGIVLIQANSSSSVSSNTVSGNASGIYTFYTNGVTLGTNTLSSDTYGFIINGGEGVYVSGNSVSGGDYGIYNYAGWTTPTTISGNTLSGVDTGIVLDEGGAALTGGNSISGGSVGILAYAYDGATGDSIGVLNGSNVINGAATGIQLYDEDTTDAADPIVTVSSATIENCTVAVDVGGGLAQVGGSTLTGNTTAFRGTDGELQAHFNRVVGSTTGASGTSPAVVNVTNNWWGTNSGPTTTGTVTAGPWLVLTLTPSPASIGTGGTSTLTASLTKNSDGVDTAASGHVPNGIGVTFATDFGSLSSTSGTTSSGTAASTLTAPATAGVAHTSATVDSQTVYADVNVLPALSVSGVTHDEGDSGTTTYTFTVTLSVSSSQTVTVNYATSDATATVGDNDYVATSGTLTFSPGQTSKTFDVTVKGDTKYETDETFTVTLSSPTNAAINSGQGTATGTITNDDDQPEVSITAAVTHDEGDSGTTPYVFTVTLSNASYQTVTVGYATANGTATTADNDYVSNTGTLSFTPGQTSQTVTVLVKRDAKYETDEDFTLSLSSPSNATIASGQGTGTGTITNDDDEPTISIQDASANEGNSGTTNFTFTVTLSNPSYQTITVDWDTADGTAEDGTDYTAGSGTLTFNPGQTSKTITVAVSGDTDGESDETFTVSLSSPSNATIDDGTATGTIRNDDGTPTVSISGSDGSVTALKEGGDGVTTAFTFTVTLSHSSSLTVQVSYQTNDGTATTTDGDYQGITATVLTFNPGETSQTVTVNVNGDIRYEDGLDETFTVTLSGPSNATLGTNSATGKILADDAPQAATTAKICPTDGGDLNGAPPMSVGGVPTGTSPYPVRYFDGTVQVATTDVQSSGLGYPWGHTRSWTNGPGYAENTANGNGWVVTELPYLQQPASDTVVMISNGTAAHYYTLSGGTYQSQLNDTSTLTYNSTTHEFVLTDGYGSTITYYDFSTSLPAAQRGAFKSYTDPYGNTVTATAYNGSGRVTQVQRSGTSGGVTVDERLTYAYNASGLLESVTLERQTNGGGYQPVESVQYEYYTGTEKLKHGNAGDLKSATTYDCLGQAVGTTYYRYYTSDSATGYKGGLEYVVGPESYARMTGGGPVDPDSFSDAYVAQFADNYFEYDSQGRVTKEIAAGAGCSVCTGGQGTFTYSYAVSSNPDGVNSWRYKTTETLPDGSQNVVYSNVYGEVMLVAFTDAATSQTWRTFYEYDDDGRVTLMAAPSAVTGHDESYADLLHKQSGNYQYMSDSAGLVYDYDYYTSTTAGESTAGGADGYLQAENIRHGETGTAIPLASYQYYAHSAGGATIFPLATVTLYRNDDGTGAETTTYTYTWYTGAAAAGVQSVTASYPVVSSGQNGPGTADTESLYFNAFGRPVWFKDAGGFLHYTQYDLASGGVTKTITDVNTSLTSTFSGLPSGWSTPSGGGLHVTATADVDVYGRPTKETDPNGNVTYTVYDDADHEVRVYDGWDPSWNVPTGPTFVYREDWVHGYTEVLTMSAAPYVVNGRPTGTEAISGVQTLYREQENYAGQVVASDEYFNLTGVTYGTLPTLGTEGTNYYRTDYGYDNHGLTSRVENPTGTIYRTVYDGQGRPVSVWVGTDDTPASGTWSPSNPAGMSKVVEYQYDNGGVGNSNLTEIKLIPGGGSPDEVTQFYYDWRDRPVAFKDGVEATEDTSVNRPIYYYTYDNLGEVTRVQLYDGDGVTITSSGGVPQAPSSSLLRAQTDYRYDDQGRLYEAATYSVNPSTGVVSSSALTTDLWYDRRSGLIKMEQPGGLVTKYAYDGAGRLTAVYYTDGGGDSGWSDADDVTGDAVLEQLEYAYDANGNLIQITDRQRFHDETDTGSLGGPSNDPKARVYYAGYYYDRADRLTAVADVGTNGGSAWTRPSTAPAPSDTALVTSYGYNAAGWVDTIVDPSGTVTKFYYDNLGRTTKTVEAYTNGTVTDTTNRTTEYTYDGDGHVLTVTARQPGGGQETTQYVYGVTAGGGSAVDSNDLMAAVRYPDPSAGAASSSEEESYTVNALGQVTSFTDRNGTTHEYTYDALGRLVSDAVTDFGAGVDDTVARVEYRYDALGYLSTATSYDAATGGNVVNQVRYEYNGLGQLTREYQEHNGAVNTSTTPYVEYTYSEMAGGANHSRLTSITYPDGYTVSYNYDSGMDDSISRLSSISDSTGTLESYEYLGLGMVVVRSHPQPGIDLTYVRQGSEPTGDAGDQYTGLDRFGQVADQRWVDTSTGSDVDRYRYGYDRDGNRTYRENVVDATFSELYSYDELGQLTSFDRGTLNSNKTGITGTAQRSQDWDYDAQGNWDSVTTDGSTETRTHNDQNEITGISGAMTPTYDANGSLTQDEAGQFYVYDAWNHLVRVEDTDHNPVAEYTYDALGRRITETVGGTTTDLYYSASSQVLEERVSGEPSARYVWSPVYFDALVLRDRDTDADGEMDERLWAVQDANWNVTALVDADGDVVERYIYDPFGAVTVLAPDWTERGSSDYDWRYLHQGLRYQWETENYYNFGRDLRPSLGRFLQNDPLGLAAGDVSLYRYVGNNPVNLVDPTGASSVGHHWVPVSVVMDDDILPHLSKGAVTTQAGSYSGPTWPSHNFGTYGGMSHYDYNRLVKDEMLHFMENEGIIRRDGDKIIGIRKMRPDEMERFVENVRTGTNLSSKSACKGVGAFNRDIMKQRTAFEKKYKVAPLPTDRKSITAAGRAQVQNSARYAAMGALSMLFVGLKATDVLSAMESSPNYRNALNAANAGNLLAFERAVVGMGSDPTGNHLFNDIYKALDLGLAGEAARIEVYERVRGFVTGLGTKVRTINNLPQ